MAFATRDAVLRRLVEFYDRPEERAVLDPPGEPGRYTLFEYQPDVENRVFWEVVDGMLARGALPVPTEGDEALWVAYKTTRRFIEMEYDAGKQASDAVDLGYSTASLSLKTGREVGELYREGLLQARRILDQGARLDDLLQAYPREETLEWEQLIETLGRYNWTVRCKNVYRGHRSEYRRTGRIDFVQMLREFPPVPDYGETPIELSVLYE